MTLQRATPDDREFAFDLKKAALGDYIRQAFGWEEEEQRMLHEKRFRPDETRNIRWQGQEVGLITLREAADRVYLLQLFLLPAAQGHGLGAHVLGQVLEEARQKYLSVMLQVLKTNPRARKFYQRHGFAVVGETETHYRMERVF